MAVSETSNCRAWDCKSYESDMMSYGRADVPDYIRINIGLDIQDKCEKIDTCYYAQVLGSIAENGAAVAEGVQNA